MNRTANLKYEIGVSLALSLLASTVYAQATGATQESQNSTSATEATANPQATAEPEAGLGEIVVTANRRSENLQRAALAVDAASGESLARTGLTSATQLQQVSPSLVVSNVGGSNIAFFIRGVGNFSSNAYTDPATAFNFDGVYVARPAGTAGLFYDLERIEVLKGPQGTLYGRNATAGAINVIPVKPKLGELSAKIVGSYGNYNAVNVQGAINAPVGENGAVRISATSSNHDGYLSDRTSDEDVKALRLQMLADLTPDLTVRIDADYAHVGGKGYGSYYASSITGLNTATGRYNFSPTGFDPSVGVLDAASQAYRTSRFSGQVKANLPALPADQFQHDNFYGMLAEVNYKTPVGTLTILPAYRTSSLNDQQSSPGFTPSTKEKFEQTSVETRLTGTVSAFDYIVGAYFYDENNIGNYTFAQQVLSSYQDFESKTRSYAGFGRLTWKVTDRFRLTGGVRYTHDKKDFDGSADTILQICVQAACPNAPFIPLTDRPDQLPFAVPARGGAPTPVIVNGAFTGAITVRSPVVVDTSLSTSKVTYHGSAEYDLGDRSLLYANIDTGFHSGGFSLAAGKETFQPETITAYTIGSKNRFFDNRLQLNIEAFYWKYANQQVAHFGIDGTGGQAFFTENVGRSTIKGVDVDAQVQVTDTTLLTGSVQYLDAKYTSFKYDVPASGGAPNVGCNYAANPTNSALITVDCSGNQAFQSPKWTLTVGAQQTIPLGDFNLVLAGDTQYRTKRVVAFEYVPPEIAPSVWQSNASVTLNRKNGWSIAGFVRNIENKRTPVSGTLFGAGNFVTIRTDPPRTYGVRVTAAF